MLHAASHSSKGGRLGSCVLHYRDGGQAELPLVYGEDTDDFGVHGESNRQRKDASVAWTGSGGVEGVRLFLRTYDNPRPEAEIATIDFVSANAHPAPFVAAITLE
jgi:hypothetical protein